MIKNSLKIFMVMLLACTLFAGTVFADELTGVTASEEQPTVSETLESEEESEETADAEEETVSGETADAEEETVSGETADTEEETVSEETADSKEETETLEAENEGELYVEGSSIDKSDLEIKDLGDVDIQYDDRYVFSEILAKAYCANYEIAYIETEGDIESYQVENGQVSSQKDENVLEQLETQKVCATGIGTAYVYFSEKSDIETVKKLLEGKKISNYTGSVPKTLKVTVDVEPATLTIMYLAGQSNMEGLCSSNTGDQVDYSIANTEGNVYSTYAPAYVSHGKKITGISGLSKGTIANARSLVAGGLGYTADNKSLDGTELTYPIYALTTSGNGKTGPDSALAYNWNKITGEKVWLINVAVGGSSITSWYPGESNYKRALEYFNDAGETFAAEIASGHYIQGRRLMFWMQGEDDYELSAAVYKNYFLKTMASFKSALKLEKIGVMVSRASGKANKGKVDVRLTGPRAVQYAISANSSYSYISIVNSDSDKWISDSAVKKYFASAYSTYDYLDYPIRNSKGRTLPTTQAEIHDDVHFSQIGHNQNGLNAALNMYELISAGSSVNATKAYWVNSSYSKITTVGICTGTSINVAAVTTPSYGKVTVKASNKHAVYNAKTGQITGKTSGSTKFVIKSGSETLATLKVYVRTPKEFIKISGKKTGLYNYNGTIYYLTNGKVDKSFTGIAKYGSNLYYVNKGMIDRNTKGLVKYNKKTYLVYDGVVAKSTSGFVQVDSTWYYFSNGVLQKTTTLYKGTVNGESGYWYVVNGKVKFVTTVALRISNNKRYYVKNGKVDFTYTGPATDENSATTKIWWYIAKGKVNENFTGFSTTSTGQWYVNKGKMDLSLTGIIKVDDEYWYIKNDKADPTLTANVLLGNTTWCVIKGKVDKTFWGIKKVGTDKWYVKYGVVRTDYTGKVKWKNKIYTISQGKVTGVAKAS